MVIQFNFIIVSLMNGYAMFIIDITFSVKRHIYMYNIRLIYITRLEICKIVHSKLKFTQVSRYNTGDLCLSESVENICSYRFINCSFHEYEYNEKDINVRNRPMFVNLYSKDSCMVYGASLKLYLCDRCPKTYSNIGNLKNNMQVHTGKTLFV